MFMQSSGGVGQRAQQVRRVSAMGIRAFFPGYEPPPTYSAVNVSNFAVPPTGGVLFTS